MGAFQVKADDQIAERASAAIEQYRANHDLANRGDALAQLLPLLERAAVEGGADPEAEKMLGHIKSLTAALEVEAQALATRVATARATERAAVADELENVKKAFATARDEANALRAEKDDLLHRVMDLKSENVKQAEEIEKLRDQLAAALDLRARVEQQNN